MKEFRGGIIRLFEQGKSGYQIAKDMKLPYTTVRDTIRRYRETGNYNDRPRRWGPRTARTPAKIRKINPAESEQSKEFYTKNGQRSWNWKKFSVAKS